MLSRRLVPLAIRSRLAGFLAAPAPVALASAQRAYAAKKSDAEEDLDDDALFDGNFGYLDEFLGLDEGFGDSIDFLPEEEAKLLFAETPRSTPKK